MYTVTTFESVAQLQTFLRSDVARGEYYKTLRAGLLYYLITVA